MNVAIIAAAGQGTRMAGERPKQFLELAGTPIIFHTLQAFERCDSIQEIIVVIPAAESAAFLSLANKHSLRKLSKVVPGGATRAESVLCGLRAVRETTVDIVAVHDGVRPFVTPEEIARTIAAAQEAGAAVLVSSPVDTVKEVRDGAEKTGDALQRGAEKTGEALKSAAESTGEVINKTVDAASRVKVDVNVTTRPATTQARP